MIDGMKINLQGVNETSTRLFMIGKNLQKKVGSRAVRKGANIIRDAARANARAVNDPNTPENIEKNIVVQSASRLGRRNQGVAARVGVLGGARSPGSATARRKAERRRQREGTRSLLELGEIQGAGKNNPGGDTWYWRLLEFGTQRIAPRPFLRPAVAQNEDAAITAVMSEIDKQLDRLEELM